MSTTPTTELPTKVLANVFSRRNWKHNVPVLILFFISLVLFTRHISQKLDTASLMEDVADSQDYAYVEHVHKKMRDGMVLSGKLRHKNVNAGPKRLPREPDLHPLPAGVDAPGA